MTHVEKPYELFGIPENAWLEYDQPPSYATVFQRVGEVDPFDSPHGLIPGEVRLWGQADYWTALEAALLLVGLSPTDEQLYAVERQIVPDEGFGTNYYCWKYAYKFDSARDYLFLFERSCLAPKAAPIEWVKYFNNKVRDVAVVPPFEPNYSDIWQEFFDGRLTEDSCETIGASEKSRPAQRPFFSNRLAILNQAAQRWWGNADRVDRATHPKNSDVVAWLVKHGYTLTLAEKAATIIRPEWAPTGRKPEE